MFVYAGKLQWMNYGKGELFVVVLPNGPVRVGDVVYFYSQWTVDSKAVKKGNFFGRLTVEKISKAENGDDTFQTTHGYYLWEFQSSQGYQKLTVNMSNPGGSKSAMILDRTYQPNPKSSSDPGRIWTGKLNWPQHAENELVVLIVPEGLGAGKPVLAFWHWTVSAPGVAGAPCLLKAVQQADTPGEGNLKFSFTDHYTLVCTWDMKTEQLALNIQEPEKGGQDVGLTLAALIDAHCEDVTPPEFPAGKVDLEVRYPQLEPSLPRIHTPMPFPHTLVETLTHTASYLDEAGYLAKYAVQRYQALDKAYHALLKQIDDLNGNIRDLTGDIRELTVVNEEEKKQIEALQKKLADTLNEAAKKEAELTKEVHDLQKSLVDEEKHDAADHKALDEAHNQIKKEQEARVVAEKQVVTLQFALNECQKRVAQLQAQAAELVGEISSLRGLLSAEKAQNAQLTRQVGELIDRINVLENEAAAAKKVLALTTEDLKKAQEDLQAKDAIITGFKNDLTTAKKEFEAKETAYEELQRSTSLTIQLLEAEIAALKAKWPFPDDFPDLSDPYRFPDPSKLPDPSKFPDPSNFPDPSKFPF